MERSRLSLRNSFRNHFAEQNNKVADLKGQLTVTCGDLLEGLTNCADDAFRYDSFAGSAGSFSQCFHITLYFYKVPTISDLL